MAAARRAAPPPPPGPSPPGHRASPPAPAPPGRARRPPRRGPGPQRRSRRPGRSPWAAVGAHGARSYDGHMSEEAQPAVVVTDAAREKILEVRADEPDADALALWVEVSGESAGAFSYTMELGPLAEAGTDDLVQGHDDLSLVVPSSSVDRLRGATLDFAGAGMVMQNPNRPAAAPSAGARPSADLSGPVAQAVLTVLDEQINPAIAAHHAHTHL